MDLKNMNILNNYASYRGCNSDKKFRFPRIYKLQP